MHPPGPARLLALSVLIVTVSTQPVFLLGASFLQMGPELGFGPTGLGGLTSLFFLAASVASGPLGRVVQRIGWQRALRVNLVVSAAVLVAVPIVAHTFAVLAVLLVVGGAVYGVANPAANQALADHVDPRHRAVVFGIKHAGIPSSTLVAGLALPLVVLTSGWRAAYLLAAGLAVVVWALIPRGRVAVATGRFPADTRRSVVPLTTARLLAVAGANALASWGAIALATYLVAASVDLGFTESAAGLLLFAGSVTAILARVGAGALTDRFGGRGFIGVAALMGAGAVVFVVLTAAQGPHFAALVMAAFATASGWQGLMTYAVVNANALSAASSSGVTQTGIFVGAAAGPVAVGRIVDVVSFDAGWLLAAAALAVASVVVWVVGRGVTRTATV